VFAAVKAGDILEVVWVSLLAGVIACLTFAIVVLGSARSADARRNGHGTASYAFGALAVIALTAFLGGVAYGVHIILSKS
jgi:hypothetical protein